ncbi:MAG TPA: POT family MFS transporter [Chthoniobacterales bacterium]|nr:POT family MFS transporter [Chthoniobacterales bacterium]
MASPKYATSPPNITGMPPGVPYIIGNEGAERFSFYGMRTILIGFMTQFLVNKSGVLEGMPQHEAQGWFHQFVSSVYWMPLIGAIISDGWLGKYRTIFYLSIVYCLGHFTLALMDTQAGIAFGQKWVLAIGLFLIAMGAGGIKPCVSANVGDQFGESNKHLIERVFGWFYFSINLGSSFSIWLCPVLLRDPNWGPKYAFGLPGVLMLIATIIFWMGRNKMVHVPPGGLGFLRDVASKEGRSVLARVWIIFAFTMIFWALWDQSSGGEWTIQCQKMDLHFMGINFLPEQVNVVNGIFILAMIPLFNYWGYPAISRVFPLTPIRKIGIGLFLTAISFVIIWMIQLNIDHGGRPGVGWQFLAYIILSAGEVMVSITGLEFAYTQAPNRMKSLLMAMWLLSISLGNQIPSIISFLIPKLKSMGMNLEGANYFRFFTLLMLGTSIIYIFVSKHYKERTYLQSQVEEDERVTEPLLAGGTPT